MGFHLSISLSSLQSGKGLSACSLVRRTGSCGHTQNFFRPRDLRPRSGVVLPLYWIVGTTLVHQDPVNHREGDTAFSPPPENYELGPGVQVLPLYCCEEAGVSGFPDPFNLREENNGLELDMSTSSR